MEDNLDEGTETVKAYVVGLRGKLNFGPAYFNAIIDYGLNPANYGESIGTGISGFAAYIEADDKFVDYKNLGFALAVGFKVNDMVSLEAGYGMNKGEWDEQDYPEQENSAYYVNVPITLASRRAGGPGIVKFDFGETKFSDGDKIDQGDQTAFGAVWYISF